MVFSSVVGPAWRHGPIGTLAPICAPDLPLILEEEGECLETEVRLGGRLVKGRRTPRG